MTEAVPWVKWRFDQWRGEAGLRLCSLAARGLWIELLSFMHGGKPYGHLSLNGIAPSNKEIAEMVGFTTEKEVKAALQQLENRGVFSRTEGGMIFSRRLVRDNASRHRMSAIGKQGGNPALNGDISEPDKQEVNLEDKQGDKQEVNQPLIHEVKQEVKIERRKKKEETETDSVSQATPPGKGTRLPPNWLPNQSGYEIAVMEGIDPSRELEKFRDYWHALPGQKGVKVDWQATWRNWCRSPYNKSGSSNAGAQLAAELGLDLLTPIRQQFPKEEHHDEPNRLEACPSASLSDRDFHGGR